MSDLFGICWTGEHVATAEFARPAVDGGELPVRIVHLAGVVDHLAVHGCALALMKARRDDAVSSVVLVVNCRRSILNVCPILEEFEEFRGRKAIFIFTHAALGAAVLLAAACRPFIAAPAAPIGLLNDERLMTAIVNLRPGVPAAAWQKLSSSVTTGEQAEAAGIVDVVFRDERRLLACFTEH